MKEFNYTITDPQGIHARPAGVLVKEAAKYQSTITLEKGGNTLNVKVEGQDEDEAAKALEEFFKANL